MEAWKFIKEEPKDDEYYETEANFYNTLDSDSTIKSKKLCEVKIENGEEFYSTLNSGGLYNVKIESEDEFYSELDSEQICEVDFETKDEFHSEFDSKPLLCDHGIEIKEEFLKGEENNNQDAWQSASLSDYPKLSISLVRLECSKNQEVIKYLTPLLPGITSSTKFQSPEQTIDTNLNLKAESVELETLTQNTLVQSPKNKYYASPWDFVSVPNTFDHNDLTKKTVKTEFEDESVLTKEYKGGTFGEFFKHNSNRQPRDSSTIHNAKVLKKKFTQQTLNFKFVSKKHREVEVPVQFSNYDSSEHANELQAQNSDPDFQSEKYFFCKFCDQKFKRKSDLTRHERNKHSDEDPAAEKIKETVKKYTCEICGRPSSQMSLLRRHYATHDATKRYECDTCKKKFKTKWYLRQHIEAHDSKKYTCKYCSRLYTRKSTLRRHMKLHSAGDVKIRKYTPKTQTSELKLKNNNNDEKARTEATLKLYKCDVCGQSFEDKSSMKVHIEFLHIEIFGERANAPQPRTSKPSLKKRFQCSICDKRYTQSSHLKRHEESHLPRHSRICELCGQNFSTTSSLSRHLRVKHDVIRYTRRKAPKKLKKTPTDFTCKICGRVLTNLGDLRRHCATHDARKPYECDICKKQFAVKGYLYAHILTHDNWKPYPCEICSKVYRRKSSLQRHIQISHLEKITIKN